MDLRDQVLGALEPLRKDQVIGSNQEAAVQIVLNDEELLALVNDLGIEAFAALCIVSQASVEKGPALKITAGKSPYPKCQRWELVAQCGAGCRLAGPMQPLHPGCSGVSR